MSENNLAHFYLRPFTPLVDTYKIQKIGYAKRHYEPLMFARELDQ